MSQKHKKCLTHTKEVQLKIEVANEMKRIWEINKTDFLGFELVPGYSFSYHHIKKVQHNGDTCIDNGAILVRETGHSYIHTIECYNLKMFAELQKIMRIVNNQQKLPTKAQLIWINEILYEFEKEFDGEKSAQGTFLLKPDYKRRLSPENKIYNFTEPWTGGVPT